MTTNNELINEIKVDLGSDINSLGISDKTIDMKITEALRKISSYAPLVEVKSFHVEGKAVVLPENTVTVVNVYTMKLSNSTASDTTLYQNDTDLFSYSRYLYNYNSTSDPYIYLLQKTGINTLQNFVSMKDWWFDRQNHQVLINNYNVDSVTVMYLRKYQAIEEVVDELVIQKVKEYALALCKIVEGNIRRKLQNAPGAISMDGDSLVSEGMQEKQILDESLPIDFQYLRMGIRA